MDSASYNWMREGVSYNSYYSLGGECVIKKAAEDIEQGIITVRFPDGTVKRRHYAFFTLMGESTVQSS